MYAAPEPGIIPTTGDVTYYRDSTELKYASTYDIRVLTVGGVTIGDPGNSGSISANEIVAKKIVGSAGSNPSAISINGATFADGGAITATGLKLGTDYDVKEKIDKNIENITTNKNALQALTEDGGRISSLEGRVGTNETNIVALETKTANLSANGKKLTNMEEVGATKLAVGGKEITADTVARYDAAVSKTTNITYDAATQKTYINKGTDQQVVIDAKGLKVGKNTSRMNDITGFATSKNLYVGTTDADNPTAADSKFFVDGATGETVVNGTGGKTTIYGGGITVDSADNNSHVLINNGTVNAIVSVVSPNFFVDLNNAFAANSLKVGDGTNGVTIADGKITTTGDATVGGTLDVTGEATFAKETAFANGIKTNKISENTDGEGVTVDGVVLKDGGITATGNVTTTGDIQGKDINATGALKGKTLGIGTNGSEFTVDANGNAAVGGTLDVTGKTTLKNELQVNEKATFGIAIGSQTVINGGDITATGKLTSKSASIGTVGITDTGVVTGITKLTAKELDVTDSLNIAGDIAGSTLKGNSLKITGDATIGGGLAVTGNITGAKINGAAITETSFNGAQISTNKFNGVTLETNGNVTGGTITGTIVMDGAGASMNAGTVTGTTITDGNGFTATGGNVVAKKITADTAIIAGVNFAAGGSVSGINDLTATGTIKGSILKVDETNYWNSEGLQAKKAVIDSVVIDDASITTTGANGLKVENVKLDNGAITADSAIIGGVNKLDNTGISVATDQKIQVGNNTVIEDGSVKVSQKTSLTDQSLQLNDTNKWTQAGGLVADKATVNGIALGTDSKGKATFTGADGQTTTIDGNKINTGIITADKLLIDKISLGKDGNDNISIDKNGNVTTKGDVTVTGADSDTTVIDGAKATFGKDAANQTVIDKGTISANAKNINGQQAGLTFDETGLTVKGQNAEGKASSFSFNAKTGDNTFTGQDKTTTTINGSSVRSYNSATGAGHLNGATLNLWKDNDNSTYMTAGGVTFTGDAGEKGGKVTTINGGTISTDTLNVERINLGEDILDSNGNPHGSNLSMDKQGNFSAAGGNFKVTGGSGADKGAFTNTVGNTTLQTDNAGASMKFDNTAAEGGVTSEVAVGKNKATVAAGDKASFVANTDNGGSATITGGTQTVTTTGKGTVFENSAHKTPFVENGATTTIINGNEITTGKITTDQLVITGQGNAHGNGSIAFGGNGTIKSDINDGTNHTTFETEKFGTTTTVTNGQTTTENKVTAAGNSNTVTKDNTHKSEFKQGFTSIGGVVTNGTVNIAQTLNGENGSITNEVTDTAENGKSSKLVQNGTGLEYTDNTNAGNATRINSSDVSIGSATEPDKRINLSDLGQIDKLDKELTGHDKYKDNPTAVGGINAEAAIRREEVARLDGRINDVNDRVNKVGAMAAAIASLKSIGYDPQAPSEFSIGLGQYKGETGVAMGFFHYPNKNFMINVSLSTAGGETMGGIGATWRFGHKSPQKLLEEQREAQAKKELAAAEKYQAAAKLAKEAQERAEYAAKLARQAQVSADNAKAAADATQAKHFG